MKCAGIFLSSYAAGKKKMGFLFYANFVRFVVEGGYRQVLAERAWAWMRAAGAVAANDWKQR
jgi:hypothetical protein